VTVAFGDGVAVPFVAFCAAASAASSASGARRRSILAGVPFRKIKFEALEEAVQRVSPHRE